MKKTIFSFIVMMFMTISMFAQINTNCTNKSKFTDNWSVTLQGGVNTSMSNFFSGHTAMTPIIVLGVDKYITPTIGVGFDARTAIGTGCEIHNPHTAFDAVNLNGYAKVNLANISWFKPSTGYKNGRNWFEPVVYTGIGWGHNTCSAYPALSSNYNAGVEGVPTELYGTSLRNYVTFRSGVELNFNLGKKRDLAIVVNPSVVWGNIDNMRLAKRNGSFEVTAGLVYHFRTSNGTNHFVEPKPVIVEKEIPVETIKEVVKTVELTKIVEVPTTWLVKFKYNSAEIENVADLHKVVGPVDIVGYASPEGSASYNVRLSQMRAENVADFLRSHGVKVNSVTAQGATDAAGRIVVITTSK